VNVVTFGKFYSTSFPAGFSGLQPSN